MTELKGWFGGQDSIQLGLEVGGCCFRGKASPCFLFGFKDFCSVGLSSLRMSDFCPPQPEFVGRSYIVFQPCGVLVGVQHSTICSCMWFGHVSGGLLRLRPELLCLVVLLIEIEG